LLSLAILLVSACLGQRCSSSASVQLETDESLRLRNGSCSLGDRGVGRLSCARLGKI
jgi:hypothetical protein